MRFIFQGLFRARPVLTIDRDLRLGPGKTKDSLLCKRSSARANRETMPSFLIKSSSYKKAPDTSGALWLHVICQFRKNTRSFKLGKGDCLCPVLIVECDDDLIVVQEYLHIYNSSFFI